MNATVIENTFRGQSPYAAPDSVPYAQAGRTARSRKAIRTGRFLSGVAVLFLTLDGAMKLLALPFVVEASTRMGYPASAIAGIGILQLVCLAAYLTPRTAPIGAVLETGYLGGAIATHVRVGDPLFSHILFPAYIAALLWAGLWLRDRRVGNLLAPASAGR